MNRNDSTSKHTRPTLLVGALMFAWVCQPAPGFANPPKLDYLYPAGARRGTTIKVTAGGTFKTWPIQVWTSDSGVTWKPAKKRGQFTVTVAKDVRPGLCWLRLHDKFGASGLRPFLIGMLPEISEREPNDEPRTAPTLKTTAVTINGRLQRAGDVDVHGLNLQQGQTLVASLEAHQQLKSPMDGILQVVSATGHVVAQNDDYHGFDPQIVFRVPKDGRYFVRAFAFPATPNSSIRFAGEATYVYRLTLTTAGFADHAMPFAVSRSAPGKVNLIGWNIDGRAKRVPVTIREDIGVAFHADVANPVRVRLEPHPVAVENMQKNNAPQSVALPSTLTGTVATANETDTYQLTLKKGQRFHITVEAATMASPLDPILRITSAGGKQIKQIFSKRIGTDPALNFTAPATGGYRLEVTDLHQRGGPRYVYRLRLTKLVPAFTLKVAQDRFAFAPGKSVEIPVTIERHNGWKEAIAIVVAGLPAGITAKPVQAGSKAKSIKLRLTGQGTLAFGTFRILGQGVDTKKKIVATAAVTEMATSTRDLWITMSNAVPATSKKKKK